MDITQFVFDLVFGQKYSSPRTEGSVFKGIPIEYRDMPEMKRFMKQNNLRSRYRGPRRRAWDCNGKFTVTTLGKQDCLKSDATHFSLYKA